MEVNKKGIAMSNNQTYLPYEATYQLLTEDAVNEDGDFYPDIIRTKYAILWDGDVHGIVAEYSGRIRVITGEDYEDLMVHFAESAYLASWKDDQDEEDLIANTINAQKKDNEDLIRNTIEAQKLDAEELSMLTKAWQQFSPAKKPKGIQ